jgi:hypothetical protein
VPGARRTGRARTRGFVEDSGRSVHVGCPDDAAELIAALRDTAASRLAAFFAKLNAGPNRWNDVAHRGTLRFRFANTPTAAWEALRSDASPSLTPALAGAY